MYVFIIIIVCVCARVCARVCYRTCVQMPDDNLVDSMLPTTHSKQRCSFCSFRFVEFLSLPQVAELLGYFLQSALRMHLAGSVGEWDCVFLDFADTENTDII